MAKNAVIMSCELELMQCELRVMRWMGFYWVENKSAWERLGNQALKQSNAAIDFYMCISKLLSICWLAVAKAH